MNAPESPPIRLTELAHGGGCGCKVAPGVLREILANAGGTVVPPQLLVGIETADDAAVYELNKRQAIVATTDFFMPIVDDPFDFGAIAATNALSDVYAMGAKPIFALAIVGMPIAKLPAATDPMKAVAPLRPELDRTQLRAITVTQSEENTTEAIDQLSEFIGIVGLVALLLGGVGVASGVRAFVARKIDTVAILRCLGASSGQVLAMYVAQAAVMGIVGALACAILGHASLGGQGFDNSMGAQFVIQLKGVLFSVAWSGIVTAIIFYLIKLTIGLRPTEEIEREGLDIAEHGERAYD